MEVLETLISRCWRLILWANWVQEELVSKWQIKNARKGGRHVRKDWEDAKLELIQQGQSLTKKMPFQKHSEWTWKVQYCLFQNQRRGEIPRWNSLAEVMDQKVHFFYMLHRKNSARCDSELGCEDIRRIQSRRLCRRYRSEKSVFSPWLKMEGEWD